MFAVTEVLLRATEPIHLNVLRVMVLLILEEVLTIHAVAKAVLVHTTITIRAVHALTIVDRLIHQEAVVVQVVVAFPEAVVHLVQVVVAIPVVADLLYVPVEVDVKYSVLPCV